LKTRSQPFLQNYDRYPITQNVISLKTPQV
jgi:hypothetical protein